MNYTLTPKQLIARLATETSPPVALECHRNGKRQTITLRNETERQRWLTAFSAMPDREANGWTVLN